VGNARSHGKGFRAITYSGFTLALMEVAIAHGRGHPGAVVLDTPLRVYKEPEDYDIKGHSLESPTTLPDDRQVIVIEKPAVGIEDLNLIVFSKIHGHGRYGFLPESCGRGEPIRLPSTNPLTDLHFCCAGRR